MSTSESFKATIKIVYISLIAVGCILSLIALSLTSKSSVDVSISAYSILAFGIVLFIGGLIINIPANVSFFKLFINNLGPFVLTLCIVGYLLSLVIIYKAQIVNGDVSTGYGLFSKLSLLFIIIQIAICYNGINEKSYLENGTMSKVYSRLTYLVGVVNIAIVTILATILKYFSTDG